MKTSLTSACRHCRHYTPEGRRGGQCQQLNVPVQGGWAACALALPPFAPSWEDMEEIVLWQQEAAILREAIAIQCAGINNNQPTNATLPEKSTQVASL